MHQQDVHYMLVCRAPLGYSCRTKGVDPNTSDPVMYNLDTQPPKNVFDVTVKKLSPCDLMPDASAFEYHSLVAELGLAIVRYREFVFYHDDAVPMYLIAYHRRLRGGALPTM